MSEITPWELRPRHPRTERHSLLSYRTERGGQRSRLLATAWCLGVQAFRLAGTCGAARRALGCCVPGKTNKNCFRSWPLPYQVITPAVTFQPLDALLAQVDMAPQADRLHRKPPIPALNRPMTVVARNARPTSRNQSLRQRLDDQTHHQRQAIHRPGAQAAPRGDAGRPPPGRNSRRRERGLTVDGRGSGGRCWRGSTRLALNPNADLRQSVEHGRN